MMSDDLRQVLQVATEAALEAGALLRDAFLQSGGPAGHGDHADLDDVADRLIRERLLAATPGWAYRGEEAGLSMPSGWPQPASSAYLWLVDPNDGTSAYLKGYRGSAVSIALLRDGVPVLGIVYAFVAPDNDGDLFVWAEGCGPVQRNGVPVERASWPARLSSESVILFGNYADNDPPTHLGYAAPGRYRADVSIAYRLALAAAGEGDLAVSMNSPVGWDYAAGHALVLGAGGVMVDQHGKLVTYSTKGDSHVSSCVGGAPALAATLAGRLSATSPGRHEAGAEPYGLCPASPGQHLVDNALLQRVQGCLLGQLAGDALGSMVEFQSGAGIAGTYPGGPHTITASPVWQTISGQPTDDSELALILARALLKQRAFDDEQVAAAYTYWYKSGPFDIGTTTQRAMSPMARAQEHGESIAKAGREAANRGSESNGALMRQSPLAIWGHQLAPDALDAIVRADTKLTHSSRVCQDASAAFIVALSAVIREGLDAESAYARARAWDREHGASPSVTQALAQARTTLPDFERNIGHVVIALQNAFYQALHARTFEEGVVDTVMGGGDTDTNAAIAGALLGAIHGARAVPLQWRRAILTCRAQVGVAGIHRPRPEAFWPVDVLRLAEQLALVGSRVAAASPPSSGGSPSNRRAVVGHGRSPDPVLQAPSESKFVGALLGGAIGDALGRPAEGMSPEAIHAYFGRLTTYHKWRGWKHGPIGTITDDTQLTICVAECLAHNGFLDAEDLSRRFVEWLPVGRGKGKATTAAVERLRGGVPWYLAGTEDASGNGAAMRAAPVGLLRWNDPARLRMEAILSALPTHRQPMGVAGAVAMAAATAWLLPRRPGTWTAGAFIAAVQDAITGMEPGPLRERRDPRVQTTLYDRIGMIPSLLHKQPGEVFARLFNGAYVLESLPSALYCFLRTPDDVEEMLLLAVNAGHDADTVAAMAGTLGGALNGVEGLPRQLLPELEYRAELTMLGQRLFHLATPG